MYWLIGLLTVVLIVAFTIFGGVGGSTAVFMLIALAAGIALFVMAMRDRRRRI